MASRKRTSANHKKNTQTCHGKIRLISIQRSYTTAEHQIILISGGRLAELMIEHNVGVSAASTYEIKKIDSDYSTDA
jgi:restriction endonuclease Mrr